ncbi:segregation and condensation protein A [Arthrobacter psychrochitiniphilus]|uniref:Segregation and condensation protein A n=1 Tax=Arthrobacter psychrochitiniphilus TaxID=291045 RepID=A0A2V3DQW5_9MICC|nr:segregation and condensation protein A [Arthrobacter psychrochitiniphilus]PXA65392.1 segregation/condensation protein A [Arthrobacter psychrochitiniphilus]
MNSPQNVAGIAADTPTAATPDAQAVGTTTRFEVRLDNFTGPFDLLLGLISKREMDITDVAIATVTDEFISYLKALADLGQDWALDEASEFLVLAATLLDLKAARLLPAGEVENDDDLALLEARDLLFARLLQYKAFKEVATLMGAELEREARRFPRQVGLEPHFAALLPELVWRHTPQQFAQLAARAMETKDPPRTTVGLTHLHVAPVSVREQAAIITAMLTAGMPLAPQVMGAMGSTAGTETTEIWVAQPLTFAALTADAQSSMVVIARFLALLELFRDQLVSLEQPNPLGELTVLWTAGLWREGLLSAGADPSPASVQDSDGVSDFDDESGIDHA